MKHHAKEQLSFDALLAQKAIENTPPAHDHVHVFRESLARGENARMQTFWDEAYRIHFPTVQGVERFTNMKDQRNGRDTRLTLAGGEIIHVQEKTRPDRRVDTDIALEFAHQGPRYNKPGWVELDLQIHYLAYAFAALRRVYFLPWHQLRLAWLKHGNYWKATHFIAKAPNSGYTTFSVCVPTKELRGAIARMALVELPAN
jgi:hypothetical protein